VGAARLVLRDWSAGKLPRYAVPPPSPTLTAPQDAITTAADGDDPALAAIYADVAAILERLVPRKELRQSRDVVRLSSGRVDERALAIEASWFGDGSACDDDDGDIIMEAEGRAPSDSEEDDDSDGDKSAESDAAQASVVGDEDQGAGGNARDDGDVEEDINM
jgi:nuclear GTP-binding protein